jgi:hypothetical protein
MNRSGRMLDAAFRRNRWELLVGGLVLGVLAYGPWGIALIAWFAPIPWLHYLRQNPDRRALIWFAAAQAALHLLLAAKGQLGPAGQLNAGAVAPTPWLEVMAASTLISFAHLAWRAAARRLSKHFGVLAFALLMLVADGAVRALLPAAALLLLPPGNGTSHEQFLIGLAVGEAGAMFLLRWAPAALEANWDTVYPAAMRRHLTLATLAVGGALVAGQVLALTWTPVATAAALPGFGGIAASPWPALVALLGVGALFVFDALERRHTTPGAARGMIDPW